MVHFYYSACVVLSVQCSLLADLQLFNGLSSFSNHQADFVCRDQDLLNGTVAVHLIVEAWTIPTLLDNLAQKPLCLPGGMEPRARQGICHYNLHNHPQRKRFAVVKDELR